METEGVETSAGRKYFHVYFVLLCISQMFYPCKLNTGDISCTDQFPYLFCNSEPSMTPNEIV